MSGLSVGVPGTVRGWETALKRYGTRSLRSLLRPGERIARRGFVVDQTFSDQVKGNVDVFKDFTSSRETYLTPAGTAPDVGSTHRNPDMAETYERIAKDPDRFYTGGIARDIARTVQQPPRTPDSHARGGPRVDDHARPGALPRDPAQADEGRLPRARGLRHGPAVLRRLDGRRGAQHPRGLLAARREPTRRSCTATSRRPSSPTRTATSSSATPTTSTCRCAACCPTASRPSAAR